METERRVLVRSGVPGMDGDDADGEHLYPSATSDFVKLLQERGFTVEYEHERSDRTPVSYKAAELWLPILDFTMNVAANIPANIVATLIMDFFQGSRRKLGKSILHVKYTMRDKDGEIVEFEANGEGSYVLDAMKEFDENARR